MNTKGELDLEDLDDDGDLQYLPAKVLRKMIRKMREKDGKEADEKKSDESDDEREKLSDLKEEMSGKAPRIPVDDEDMPEGLREEEDEEGESPPRKGKK